MNIESHESHSAGGVWGTSQQDSSTQCSAATVATAATAETAHSLATSVTNGGTNGGTSGSTSGAIEANGIKGTNGTAKVATSRDEHTKQRLVMLVATLQNAARELLRREALTLDSRATAVMAALDASLPANPAHQLQNPASIVGQSVNYHGKSSTNYILICKPL